MCHYIGFFSVYSHCENTSHWFDSFNCNQLCVKNLKCQVTIWNSQTIISCHIYLKQKQETWLTVYSRSNMIGVTCLNLSLTHSLIHWPTHNITQTKSYFFNQIITQKWVLTLMLGNIPSKHIPHKWMVLFLQDDG